MKFLIYAVLFATLSFSACTTSQSSVKEDISSPCNDSLYKAMQKRDTTSFTLNEKNYFHKMEKECGEKLIEAEKDDARKTALILAGAILAAVAGFFAFVSSIKVH
jgi:hypothetical protein